MEVPQAVSKRKGLILQASQSYRVTEILICLSDFSKQLPMVDKLLHNAFYTCLHVDYGFCIQLIIPLKLLTNPLIDLTAIEF